MELRHCGCLVGATSRLLWLAGGLHRQSLQSLVASIQANCAGARSDFFPALVLAFFGYVPVKSMHSSRRSWLFPFQPCTFLWFSTIPLPPEEPPQNQWWNVLRLFIGGVQTWKFLSWILGFRDQWAFPSTHCVRGWNDGIISNHPIPYIGLRPDICFWYLHLTRSFPS